MWRPVNASRTEQEKTEQTQQTPETQHALPKTPQGTQQPTRTTRRSPQQQGQGQGQQQQTHQNIQQKTATPPAGKRHNSDTEKNKKYNELYKARKYNQIIEKWGPNGKYLAKQYLILHPNRLQGRPIDEIDENQFADFMPHDWTYKLWRIANKVTSYEKGIEYIRYQVYKLLGSSKCPTTFPSGFILDKVFEHISDGSTPKQITEHQLKQRGLRIADSGLLELDPEEPNPEYWRDYKEKKNDQSDTARFLRSRSAASNQSSRRSHSRKASLAATELVKLMTGYLSDTNEYFGEDLSDDSSEEPATKLVKLHYKSTSENDVPLNPSDDSRTDSSEESSPVKSTQSNDSMDTKSTSSTVLTGKETISTHVTKSGSGALSLDSLHLETIKIIGNYLSMKDRMSLALTNSCCHGAVRHLLLQDFLTLAVDKNDLSRTKALLKDGAIVHESISKNGNSLNHPLVRAAAGGQLRITQEFLNELQKEHHKVSFEQRQNLETAAFVTASSKGAAELVEYFLLMRQDTIDVNRAFNGETALSSAVAHNRADIVELLLESGAYPTRKDLESAYGAGLADIAAIILCKYPDLGLDCSVQFRHELHGFIDAALFGAKEKLKDYMSVHNLGTIVWYISAEVHEEEILGIFFAFFGILSYAFQIDIYYAIPARISKSALIWCLEMSIGQQWIVILPGSTWMSGNFFFFHWL